MAETVLVTGASGTLGKQVVQRLRTRGYDVGEAGRRGPIRLDLATGEGLREAVAGVDIIIHAATNPLKDSWKTDVEGTKALLETARQASVRHVIYPGIVGTERVQTFPYYRVKLAAEAAIKAAGVPWTIQRATQFYELFPDVFFPLLGRFGVLIVFVGAKFQPVAVGEVADRLVEIAGKPPARMMPEFGGPEVLTMSQMAHDWKRAAGIRKPILPLPPLVGFPRRWAKGAVLTPEHREGTTRWDEWLEQRYGVSVARRTALDR